VESDPIGQFAGMNTFAYTYDNPLGYVDPYGLWGVRDIFPENAPIVTMGEAIAAMSAYAVGKATGDELLCDRRPPSQSSG
jgi:hypothetical protein